MSNGEIDSNVRLLFIGVLLLVSGLATTALFSDNLAFAESESTDDKNNAQKQAMQALEQAKAAMAEDPGSDTTEDTTDAGDAGTDV